MQGPWFRPIISADEHCGDSILIGLSTDEVPGSTDFCNSMEEWPIPTTLYMSNWKQPARDNSISKRANKKAKWCPHCPHHRSSYFHLPSTAIALSHFFFHSGRRKKAILHLNNSAQFAHLGVPLTCWLWRSLFSQASLFRFGYQAKLPPSFPPPARLHNSQVHHELCLGLSKHRHEHNAVDGVKKPTEYDGVKTKCYQIMHVYKWKYNIHRYITGSLCQQNPFY